MVEARVDHRARLVAASRTQRLIAGGRSHGSAGPPGLGHRR
jgi:hypothetical protein